MLRHSLRHGIAAVALLIALGALTSTTSAQEGPDGLVPRWGENNLLSVSGSGFKPNERVALTVRADGRTSTFMPSANAQGSFLLQTNIMVPSGASVELQAMGDQGTGKAAITAAPPLQGAGAQQGGPVTATVTTDRQSYSVGETVRFTLTVTNTGSSPVTVILPSGQRYDFVVRSSGGAEVWRWSYGRAFTLIYGEQTLDPGQTLTYSETWDQRNNNGQQVPAGQYRVTGIFTSQPPVESEPVSFRIGPGAGSGDMLAANVRTDKPAYQPGEQVQFTLTVTNPGPAPVTYMRPLGPSGQRYDFFVRTADGRGVWHWSHGKVFTLALERHTLAPGETLTFNETWDQRDNNGQQVSAGTYTVTGVYVKEDPVESAPARFSIGQDIPPGAAAGWLDRPPTSAGAGDGCPAAGQWRLAYWSGETNTPAVTALQGCPSTDRLWTNREGRWLGHSKDQPAASDTWNLLRGEASFLRGAR